MIKVKKIALTLCLLLILFIPVAMAPSHPVEIPVITEVEKSEVLATEIVPGNFIYPFKRLFENIQLFFTFDPVQKARLQLDFAGERLKEAEVLFVAKQRLDQIPLLIAEHARLVQTVEIQKRALIEPVDKVEVDKRIAVFLVDREKSLKVLEAINQATMVEITKARKPQIFKENSVDTIPLTDVVKRNYSSSMISQAKSFCLKAGGTWHFESDFIGCENANFTEESCQTSQIKDALERCEFFGAKTACSSINIWCKR